LGAASLRTKWPPAFPGPFYTQTLICLGYLDMRFFRFLRVPHECLMPGRIRRMSGLKTLYQHALWSSLKANPFCPGSVIRGHGAVGACLVTATEGRREVCGQLTRAVLSPQWSFGLYCSVELRTSECFEPMRFYIGRQSLV
jgi:hypothetical protein